MDLSKASHICQILSLPFGAYCAYAAWAQLHHAPLQPTVEAPVLAQPTSIAVGHFPATFWVAVGALGVLLVLGIVLPIIDRLLPKRLNIRSAVYGTGPVNDRDVARVLRKKQTGNAFVGLIENDLFGFDPAPNQLKRIQVEYSYGNHSVSIVSRPEHTRLVLPEDSWVQEQLARERSHAGEHFSKYSNESLEHETTKGALRGMTTYRDQAIKQRDEALAERDRLQTGLQVALNESREDREETVRSKQRAATLEEELNRSLQRQAENRKTQAEIWSLKQAARDLRRCGANPLFLARPFDRLLWLDQVRPDTKWREDALQWHETIRQSDFAKGPLQEILRSLDFDELMEELDEYERTKLGLTTSWIPANADAPMVLMMSQFEKAGKHYGTSLCNYGSTTAKNVRVLPFWIGRVLFKFEDVQLLPGGNQQEFTASTALETNGTRWRDLDIESALGFSPDCAPRVLTFFVEYENSQGHHFRSRHEGRMKDGRLAVMSKEIRQY